MNYRKMTRVKKRYLAWLTDECTDIVVYQICGKRMCCIRSLEEAVHIEISWATVQVLERKGFIQWEAGTVCGKTKHVKYARYSYTADCITMQRWLKYSEVPLDWRA